MGPLPLIVAAASLVCAGCGTGDRGDPVESVGRTETAVPSDQFEQGRLDCAVDDRVIWTTDASEPSPGVSIDQALSSYHHAVVREQDDDRAVATVEKDGRAVKVLVLTTWPNGSWSVELGSHCR